MVKKRYFPNYHIMVKPNGPVCNLDCEYCYYLYKTQFFPDSKFRMSDAVLEKFTKEYLEAQNSQEITIGWQGGEPTLRKIDFYKKAVQYQEQYKRPGTTVLNAFQTNGTLINNEWAQFFKANNFLVGISIDGPEILHNKFRHDKAGNPTHKDVLRGLELLQKFGVEYNILCTVHAGNEDHPLEVYRYFRDDLKAEFIQFIPIVENTKDLSRKIRKNLKSPIRTVSGKKYGIFLQTIFDEWVKKDVGKVFVQMFDATLASWLDSPAGICVFQPTCGFAMVLEHNGNLYSCDHFVYPENKLGNIKRKPLDVLVNTPKQYQFGKNKQDKLPQYCRDCSVLFACHGGCPKNRIISTPGGDSGLNYLCEGYKHFFTKTAPFFKAMAKLIKQGKLAAEIMNSSSKLE